VIEWSPPSVTGREDLADVGLRALERALRVGERDVAVTAVDRVERLDEVEVMHPRCR
jgi:hypothetical protein